jgi:homoserine O-acetyltransferase
MNGEAPARFLVRLETSKGDVEIEARRDWAPVGADRFYNLVRHGYYDGVRFHRVVAGKWAQFGIHGDPRISKLWRDRPIKDDPFVQSNRRGTVAYAFAVKDGRTTQVFINLRDNSETHDRAPFVPFGEVISGMDVVDSLYSGYGENAGGGIRAGKQQPLFEIGNAYLDEHFPRLDSILRAVIVE